MLDQPIEDVDAAQASYVPKDSDEVLLLLTDGSGKLTGHTVRESLGDLRARLAAPDLFDTSAPTGATAGVLNQRFWHLREPKAGKPTRADLYVYALANNGPTWGNPQIVGFVLDATTAAVALAVNIALSATQTLPGQAITITATPTGLNQPFDKIDFFADGATTPFSTATAAPWQANFSSQVLGPHTLIAVVTDSLNNPASSTPKTVTVAAAPLPVPLITFAAVGNKSVGDGAVTLTVSSTNTGAGAPPITVTTSNGAAVALTANGGVYTATFPAAGSATLTASQAAGNGYAAGSATQAVTVSAAQTAPAPMVVLETNPSAIILGDTVQLFASPSSQNSTIAKVDFYDGTTKIGTATTAPWQYAYTPTTAGQRDITAVATDALGTASASSNKQRLTVNAPTVFTQTLDPNGVYARDTLTYDPDSQGVLYYNNPVQSSVANPGSSTMYVCYPTLQTVIGQLDFDPRDAGHAFKIVLNGTSYTKDGTTGQLLGFTNGNVLLAP